MGQKPLRECRAPGCRELTREGYCSKHIGQKNNRHAIYDRESRDKDTASFYRTAAWRAARDESMRIHFGLCQDCLKKGIIKTAEMVHHVKPLRDYPELALVQKNLRPLCNRCHGKYK